MNKPLIYEPMTAFTDLIIAGISIYFAWETLSWYQVRFMNVHWHWSNAFWFLALGALLGAVSHGVGPHLPVRTASIIWKMTGLTVGITSFFFLMAAFHHVFPYDSVRWLRWIPLIFLLVYIFIILRDDRFVNVVRFYLPVIGLVLLIMIYSKLSLGNPGPGWIIIGILIGFFAAGIQISGISLHRHFNHNDLYHVIQMVGLYFMYKGGLLIRDYGVGER